MSDPGVLKGSEFLRKVQKLGRKRNIRVAFVAQRGKGSHGTLYFGDRYAIVRNLRDELKTGTLHAMLDQIGVGIKDLE